MQRRIGLLRSLLTYYGNPLYTRRLQHLYTQILAPGDLYFDIGAHVGNRIYAASKVGARVVALEPNPSLFSFLQRAFHGNDSITLLEQGVGATAGQAPFFLSERTPTVSTVSEAWLASMAQDSSFANVRWDTTLQISMTTLDELIDIYGLPQFCKLDIEGNELAALRGLSCALPCVSFEFIPAAIDSALQCIQRLEQLGGYEYNWSIAEQFIFGSETWLPAAEMVPQMTGELSGGRSGDLYARRKR